MMFLLNLPFSSFLLLALFTFFLLKWFFTLSKPPKKLPPSPRKLPIIGNLHQLGSYPHRSLQSLSKKYGQFMLLRLGSVPVLVVSSADAASEIMKTHDLIFSNRPHSGMADKLLYSSKDVSAAPYGEYWRQVRSICVLQLLSNKRVQSFRHVREEETSEMIEMIRQSCSSSSPLVNLSDIFATLTNDVVCRVALGRKYSDEGNGSKFKDILLMFGQLLGFFNMADYIPWLAWVNRFNGLDAKAEKVAKEIDEFMEGVVEERRNSKNAETQSEGTTDSIGSDFVDTLLEIQRGNLTGFAVEQDTIKALILDMFAAGTDTTYTVMEWAIAELPKHPTIMQKLQTEIRQVVQGKSEINEDDLGKMQYLKVVIKETLRLHPPIPLLLPRKSTEDINIMGYDISKDTQVIVNAWAIGRDPQLWEEPEEFRPERFLNGNIDFRGFNFELIPFRAGRRGCPGTTFAIAVNELALAKLLHKFNFALPDETSPEDLDMTECIGLTVHKRLPIRAVPSPYSS